MAQQKKKNASGEEPDTGEIKRDALHGPMKSLDAKPIKMQRLLCLGAVIWAITTLFLWRRFRLTFEMSEDQQPLTLFSENAMYYSYYLDVIRAPSSLQAIATLMRDQRSEHPTTINALERFNIYPELLLGLIYRFLRHCFSPSTLELIARTPFNFYAATIFWFQAFGVACVCVLAACLGNSLLCGICCYGFFMGNFYHRLILRTDALALREHWGLPFLWLNMIALFVMLQRHMKKNQQAKVAALFGVCLLGYPLSIVIRRIVSFYLLSFASVFLLMFAPNYLLISSPFPYAPSSIPLRLDHFSTSEITHSTADFLWCLSRLSASPRNFLFWLLAVDFRRGAVAVGVCGLIRCALIPFEKDDAHVFRILLHHLGLSESTFDSSIYMLGHTEFLPLNANLASHIKSSGVLFFSCPIAVIVMIFLGREIFLLHRLTCKNWKVFLQFDEGLEGFRGDEKQNAVVPEETKSDERLSEEHRKLEALIGENLRLRKPTLCFTALMLLIARLRVLALPLLCLFASLIVSADFWRASIERLLSAVSLPQASRRSVGPRAKRVLKIIAFFVLAPLSLTPFYIKIPLSEMLTPFPSLENANNPSKQRLVEWLSKNIPPGSGVMGDMTTSAFLRAALPSIRIVVHPQYENVVIRKRVQLTYGGAACPSMPLYNQQLRDVYKVDFLIQNSFRLVYANEEFSILQRLDEPMVDQLATETPTATSQEYLSFNWKEKIMQKSSWEPWIRRCKMTDPHCGANIAGVGLRMLEKHGLKDVASLLHSLALEHFSDPETTEQYALFLDFNLHSPAAAEKYYRASMAASTQSPSLGRAVQYALYLQENSKDDDLYIQALDGVANTASLLSLPRSELLEETDNICRGAVLLQHIAGDSRYEISAAKRTRFSESAHILWHKARVSKPPE
ncbi:hypothetical protein cyc_02539 [Cyclospora cayetanensis]|uniref:Uncharacterized protein n=1 Tax=Cyclospora cayetanensis TaxID=88456 RepID=A0A1D3CVF3_9EIME|nr:hypothetical protein cyc_02539 [Cyclospora cayetanensis]